MGSSVSKNKITSQDRAILDLKLQRDKLKKYQKGINAVLEKEVQAARTALSQGNKKKALLALKKKKYQEQLLEKTDQQLLNLEELTQSIEYAVVEKEIMDGLKNGNSVLKEIHKEMSLEAVEKLMDDTADAVAYQNEIEELLSGKISDEDEEAILQELEGLQQEELDAQLPSIPDKPIPGAERDKAGELPDVPTHIPQEQVPVKQKTGEREAMLA